MQYLLHPELFHVHDDGGFAELEPDVGLVPADAEAALHIEVPVASEDDHLFVGTVGLVGTVACA